MSNIFFSELALALQALPDKRTFYSATNKAFQLCLDQSTETSRLHLVGNFAKTDYLLKEHKAEKPFVKAVNDTRVRLRKRLELTDEEVEKYYLYDFMHVCKFVAFVCGEDVPEELKSVFPLELSYEKRGAIMGECLRVIVENWDDDYLFCQSEQTADGELVKVCYSKGNINYDFDWTYLRKMLYDNVQLNLIRPREKDGIIYPELIILEPDCLIDISTVARCFTNYAESPFVNLINRLAPSRQTRATVLGNFAGQLLDEEIHQLSESRTYLESVTDFWHDNAVSLLTAGIDSTFHGDAQLQKRNIHYAMSKALPSMVGRYNPKEGMVEPSFFSEMLGLQGRMDYLQLDFKVLLEQKSGKGEFPYDNFKRPRNKEEHYVQLLLYMALIRYNYREIYERNNRELHAFLLYSKYEDSLLGLGFAPELIFRAIKVRNGLAWSEIHFSKEDNIRLLDKLTPEMMNMKKVNNELWTRFQYNQIADVLNPIHAATPLEKAYFYRFLTFIYNEHLMSKFGNRTKENSGFAAVWHDSLEDKLLAGNIYDNLRLLSPDEGWHDRVSVVTLAFGEGNDNEVSNFRIGDVVILYSYEKGREPDARSNMVFRCSIEDIKTDTITLRLRAAQSDARVFLRSRHMLWAIEHDFMESSYGSLYRGMHAFLSAPKDRRDLLLFQRDAECDKSRMLKGDYGSFNDLSLRVKQAKDLFLIMGPPGTGKTSYGMLNTLKEELLEEGSSVLLVSYTNRAVDEICSKLLEDGIDFVRVGGGLSCAPSYRDKLLSERARKCANLYELHQLITTARVVVGTTTAMTTNLAILQLRSFSLTIIDEASQILEPHLIALLSAKREGAPSLRKIVMIGDHKQLPAVVQQANEVSMVNDPLLLDIHLTDCRLSLFERLLKKYGDNPEVSFMLTKQGRMHRDIALFPNLEFYGGKLDIVPLPHQQGELPVECDCDDTVERILRTHRIAFLDVRCKASLTDKVNQSEAEVIARFVKKIYDIEGDNFNPDTTLGIIVPYRNQIAAVRNIIDRMGVECLHDISIDTVERYQGSQRKYIIYGFTIQKYYQLAFLANNSFTDTDGSVIDRKLNVAMTRAKEHLIMLGNAPLLSNNFTFSRLMDFMKQRKAFFPEFRV